MENTTVILRQAEPGQDGHLWTGTGAYSLWLEIRATNYQGEPLIGGLNIFQKQCVVISGAETVIPLTLGE